MEHSVAWVKIKKYEELTGDTAASVHARRRAGKWRDGVQCKVVDEMLWVNLAAAERWVETWVQGTAVKE
ncbi:excisionase [Duganella sp. FT109W]|uniref:Excisionase n=1 Tax=Duganella margarita TaxID=2692170 RepID=A0A7X4H285_9BURK|nr:excisionase [Duganella margarita]MYM73550.1 excisionase [Duganella margarita]MYN40315.1 excisionase [Duganella margarita]